jgi:DNA (cytosine-5)-methyltransferase 1
MGLDLGLELAGIDVLGCVEFNENAVAAIRANRPNIKAVHGDISKLSSDEILSAVGAAKEDIDLIVGGPPCQAFSSFGKRRGTDDSRGRLVFDFVRLVGEIRPKAFLMENVRGLMSMPVEKGQPAGSLLREILLRFEGLGYRVDAFVVNSVNYGAPQIRERVLLIGNRMGYRARFPQPTHSEQPSGRQKKFATLGDAIRGLKGADPDLMDFSERKKKYLSLIPAGGNWRCLPVDLQKESMGKTWYLKGGRSAYWRRLHYDFPSPTVVTIPSHAGTSMCHPEEIRALTVGECAAIQGFPPDWRFMGSAAEKYKQVGNAVPVVLGRVAGETILRMMRDQEMTLEMNTLEMIRPQVRTRQYFKKGKVTTDCAYSPKHEGAKEEPAEES